MVGSINLILGPMFSGKTTELINRYTRYTIGGKKCLMVKHNSDTRYSKTEIVTHNNTKINAVSCKELKSLNNIVADYDVICIDEIQFYEDADIECDAWASSGLIIEACGLNGTFNRTQFKVISRLIPLVEDILYKTAICRETGNNAHFSYLNKKEKPDNEVVIGGLELYSAVDRHTYNKKINIEKSGVE
jgi:thymidine kinase